MASSGSSSSPPESSIDLPPRSARSSISDHSRKSRRSKDDRNNGFNSMRDVARVLVARERETVDLKRTLYTLSEQLKAERQRADAAENKTREVLGLFKSSNDSKNAAEQASARANEELRLYKLQYENAREELRRAQKLIDALEAQRVDAEEVAAKARSMARKLKEEKIIMRAREEGRRQGLEEGLAQGRVLGYEEGRSAGYESGREATEQAYASVPVTEMDFGTPRPRRYETPQVQVTRPSSSEESEQGIAPNYTQPLDDNMPIPPPVTTPARIPTPADPPIRPPPERPRDDQIRPISIHNITSPSHPQTEIPPDGWIPNLDGDLRIRLPPPHEMAPPPPTPSPPLSAVLNNVKNIPDEPVMIPPPSNPEPEPNRRPRHRRRNSTESQSTTMSQFEILGPPSTAPSTSTLRMTARERPNVLSAIVEEKERTSSASSPVYGLPNLSTQSFEMPTPTPGMPIPAPTAPSPNPPPPQNPSYPDTTPRYSTPRSAENVARSNDDYYRNITPRYGGGDTYRSGASNASSGYRRAEEPSRSESTYGRYGSYDDGRGGTPARVHRYSSRDNLSRSHNIYAPPHSPHSSPDSPAPPIVAPQPTLRPPPPTNPVPPDNRGSMSSNEIDIAVVPPSRPESNISRVEGVEPHHFFLSPADADRPLPVTPTEPDPSMQPPAPANPVIPPPVMMSGQRLPAGFIPMGPSSPSQVGSSTVGPAGVPLPPSSYGGSTVGPAGVPLPPSMYGGTPSVRSDARGFAGSDAPPVVPLQPSTRSSQSGGSSRNAREPYSRSATKRRDDDSDSSISSGLGSSADSLTTPPVRSRKLSKSSTPSYAAAPVPPNFAYPVPPTPRSATSNSLGSQTTRAARVPLPASVVGSTSGSLVGSAVGGPPGRTGSAFGSMRSPSEAGRARSPHMGAGRNLTSPLAAELSLPGGLPMPEPVIPIPIPEPTPITQPVMIPPSPRRPTTPLADIEPTPVIPPSSMRAPSPVASSVSAATGFTTTTKGKKGKKKR